MDLAKATPTKITSFYYLDYPDWNPEDFELAATLMYVERGEEGDDTNCILDTVVFQVYTFKYLEANYARIGKPLIERSVLIVPTIEPNWMLAYLLENGASLHEWGTMH